MGLPEKDRDVQQLELCAFNNEFLRSRMWHGTVPVGEMWLCTVFLMVAERGWLLHHHPERNKGSQSLSGQIQIEVENLRSYDR